MVRILSLNAWGGQRHTFLIRFLRHLKADILCLQEVHDTPETTQTVMYDNRDGPVRINLFSELCLALSGYQGTHHPFARHWLNDGESTELPIRYGIATFVRKGLEVIDERVDFIFGEYLDGQHGSSPLPRNLHLLRIRVPETGTEYVIAHFHGLWIDGPRKDTPEREMQAHRLVQSLRSFARLGDKLIVCGDMNLYPESLTFRLLAEEFKLRELVTELDFPGTRTRLLRERVRDAYADYMLIAPTVEMSGFEVLEEEPPISDHCPLVLDCE